MTAELWFAAGAAAIVAERVTPWAARLAVRLGCVAHPNPDVPSHDQVMPLLGGLAMLAGLAPWLAAAAIADHRWLGVIGAIAIVGVLGAYKDRVERPVRPAVQLVVQAGAMGVLAVSGFDLGVGGWVAMVGLGVVAINAWNFIDVMDGLFAGVAAMSALAFAGGGGSGGLVAAALAGACIGYLRHNWPPARLFLGDLGAFSIGAVFVALLADAIRDAGSPAPLLAIAVPLFELGATVAIRLAAGRAPWRGGPEHMALALARRGVPRPVIVIGAALLALAAARFA